MAADLDLMSALVENMEGTIPPGRDAWTAGTQQLRAAVTTLHNALLPICEATANPKP